MRMTTETGACPTQSRVLVDAAGMVVLGLMFNGLEQVRDGTKGIPAMTRLRLSRRVAIQLIVVIATSAAIVLASREIDPWPFEPSVEAPGAPSSTASAPTPRRQRQVPSEWQLRTRSFPELAAQYPLADLYTIDEIAYFKEIAFGLDPQVVALVDSDRVKKMSKEISTSRGYGLVKWCDEEVGYYIVGTPTAGDLVEVESIISRLDAFIPTLRFRAVESLESQMAVSLFVVFGSGDNHIWKEFFGVRELGRVRGLGQLWTKDFVIDRAVVMINSEQPEWVRKAAIVEEITQAMGLIDDSWWYPDSMFYQGGSASYSLADIDEAVIRLLYDPRIEPGMTIEDLERMGL